MQSYCPKHWLIPFSMMLVTLSGCSDDSQKPAQPESVKSVTATSTSSTSNKAAPENYNCGSQTSLNDLMESTWCEAKNAFSLRGADPSTEPAHFASFLEGYRQGINDARQAKSQRINKQSHSLSQHDMGYMDGYHNVLKTMGILTNKTDGNSQADTCEYQKLRQEAEMAYRQSGMNGSNLFLRENFINGFMSGGRTALTLPTSMDAFMGGNKNVEKQQAIAPPPAHSTAMILAFHHGFASGKKAMEDSVRASVEQFMMQMQSPDNLPMPDSDMLEPQAE
ncbi:hypothetical protein CI610_01926 [invertebrate metagenome]|uniref:Lipoprotein n=1 Tax=invertebrate metagenome TaxID=1711999 RepID=A0A2H9T7G6_9ZZZZ